MPPSNSVTSTDPHILVNPTHRCLLREGGPFDSANLSPRPGSAFQNAEPNYALSKQRILCNFPNPSFLPHTTTAMPRSWSQEWRASHSPATYAQSRAAQPGRCRGGADHLGGRSIGAAMSHDGAVVASPPARTGALLSVSRRALADHLHDQRPRQGEGFHRQFNKASKSQALSPTDALTKIRSQVMDQLLARYRGNIPPGGLA